MVNLRNSTESYGIIAQAFRWLVALLVLAQLGLGLYAANLPVSLARLRWLSHHKSLGLAILALVLLRLGWRALNPPPGLPGSMPPREPPAALATHRLLSLPLVLAPPPRRLFAPAPGPSGHMFGVFHGPGPGSDARH